MSEKQIAVALATRHGKLAQIAPAFEETLNWKIVLVDLDTDAFGTFTGEIKREQTAKDTAINKALAAAKESGLPYALASEGTIGANSGLPLLNTDLELLAFVDTSTGINIVEQHLSPEIVAVKAIWSAELDLDGFASKADLPNHAVIVRSQDLTFIQKGLRTTEEIKAAAKQCLNETGDLPILESDFRAMCSPSRQENIKACAIKLAKRLATNCKSCNYFGFGLVGFERGLPCIDCGLLNETAVRAEIYGCASCEETEVRPLGRQSVSAGQCQNCNP